MGVDPYRSPAMPNLEEGVMVAGLNAMGRITILPCNKKKIKLGGLHLVLEQNRIC